MPIWAILIVLIYSFTIIFVFTFSLAQLHLVYCYLFSEKSEKLNNLSFNLNHERLPFVTFQLPIFNEMYVVDRLFDSVVQIDYPKDKFEIQVLDDSTDETCGIIMKKIEFLKSQDINVSYIHRENRAGFKAGALAFGITKAKGDFIAIFDADFIIKPSFLVETLPYFNDPIIGLVQTRWLHINEKYSLLTKLQAFGLDAHFTIDQVGRNIGGYFSNFNGTGGIWRKTCIEAAGGWSADCLTEDLDLSYRAQLAGWKFKYLEDTGNLAELPAEIQAVKSQQFRWAKGAAEVAKKLLFKILGRNDLSLSTKIHTFFHLANSATYLGLMATSILTIPVILIQTKYPETANYIQFAQFFQISFLFLGIYFWGSFRQKNRNFLYFLGFYPRFLAFMMGLSLYNSVGVLQGYFDKKSPFIRTPKFNINSKTDSWLNNNYVNKKFDAYFLLEGMLCFYFLGCLIYVIKNQIWGSLPFFAMLVFGYCSVFGYGVFHRYVSWGR